MPSMLMCRACFSRCICLSFILLRIFTSAASRSCFFQRPLQATTFILCLLVRPDAVRFQVSRGHALTHKFSLPFRIVTGHKLVVTSYADGSGGPLALRTSPLASELPLTCEALPFAGGASAPYLPGCARQLFIVRCARLRQRGFALYVRLRHYRSSLLAAASNSLTFVRGADRAYCAPRKRQRGLTYAPRKWSWSPTKACQCQPPHAPRRSIGVRTRQRHLAATLPP